MNSILERVQIIGTTYNQILKLYKRCYIAPQRKMFLQNPRFNHSCNASNASSGYRYWKTFPNSSKPEPGFSFKIVSYNILAQDLLVDHLLLYKYSKNEYLRWSYRLARLTEQIVEQMPDILCLQEVQENHLAEIIANIKSRIPSMVCIYKKKTGNKPDGCAILYNKCLFELVDWNVVEFYKPEIYPLDRHNIALIAKFCCKSHKETKLLISTTHLLFNPKREDVRLAQIMVLLAELDRHSIIQRNGEFGRMPVILAGDFNFQATSAPFKLITTGKLCYESLGKKSLTESRVFGSPPTGKRFISEKLGVTDNCQYIDHVRNNLKTDAQTLQNMDQHLKDSEMFSTGTLSHGLHLRSAYNFFAGETYGSVFVNKWITVDHMFYTRPNIQKPNLKGALKLIAIYELPTIGQCRAIGVLPNENNGSDHLMLAAQFCLKLWC